jgi:hypothetical protein
MLTEFISIAGRFIAGCQAMGARQGEPGRGIACEAARVTANPKTLMFCDQKKTPT